jgi:hypothetical protein
MRTLTLETNRLDLVEPDFCRVGVLATDGIYQISTPLNCYTAIGLGLLADRLNTELLSDNDLKEFQAFIAASKTRIHHRLNDPA